MTEPLAERVRALEVENEGCAAQRVEHDAKLERIEKVLNQTTGAIRMLVVLWAIATGAAGLGVAKLWSNRGVNPPPVVNQGP